MHWNMYIHLPLKKFKRPPNQTKSSCRLQRVACVRQPAKGSGLHRLSSIRSFVDTSKNGCWLQSTLPEVFAPFKGGFNISLRIKGLNCFPQEDQIRLLSNFETRSLEKAIFTKQGLIRNLKEQFDSAPEEEWHLYNIPNWTKLSKHEEELNINNYLKT
jgi:hypothetical protein